MGKKKVHRGESLTFDVAWLGVGADGARELVDQAKERGADLVEEWVARRNAPAVLAIAEDDHAPAPARKAARRGIQVLKSRGVAIPERTRTPKIPERGAVLEAWFRPPDGAGTSAFTLGARLPEGRYKLVDVIVKDGVGLVSIAGMQMSRTQLGGTFDGIARRFGHPPAPVPVAWARARIAAARRDNDASGTPLPLGLDMQRELLGPAPTAPPPHPIEASGLPVVSREEALDRSAKLHAEPEIRGWLPEPRAIEVMLLEIGRHVGADVASEPGLAEGDAGGAEGPRRVTEHAGGAEGPRRVTEHAGGAEGPRRVTEQRVREVIEKATDSFFTERVRTNLAARMRDAAISMAARGARDRAADLVAVASAVGAMGNGTEPRTVPFLRAFFEKAFGLATARAAAQKRT